MIKPQASILLFYIAVIMLVIIVTAALSLFNVSFNLGSLLSFTGLSVGPTKFTEEVAKTNQESLVASSPGFQTFPVVQLSPTAPSPFNP